ncbi:cytochrome P450 [Streptomyces sp. NPDC093261]|uniref:cytochrome P450 n=1 Tax=Streptomyces sp. NPDC093261 TaxID=3366037 RepID=UPI0038287846
MADFRNDRLSYAIAAARECGDVWKLARGVYVAASLSACRTVLQRTNQEYSRGLMAFPPTPQPPDAVFPVRTEVAHGRSARMRGLRPQAVSGRVPEIARDIREFVADWPVNQDLEILPMMLRAFTEIGNKFMFGGDATHLAEAVEGLRKISEEMPPPRSRWYPDVDKRARAYLRAQFARKLQDVIDRRRTEQNTGEDLLAQMLQPSSQYGTLPDRVVIDSLAVMAVSMSDIPSVAAGWILLSLARHPESARRIAREAQSLPADPQDVTSFAVDRLHYTRAFVHEVLRLHPPNWLFNRQTTRRTTLNGYEVPAGAKVLVCAYSAQRDPGQQENPDEFDPSRWLSNDGQLRKVSAFLSFGDGPARCGGIALATLELTLVTAEAARRYQFHEPPGPLPSHEIHSDGCNAPAGLRLRVTTRI